MTKDLDPTHPHELRSTAEPPTHILNTPAARQAVTAEIDSMEFLGSISCSHGCLVAGSVEEVLIDYQVGSSGIADSGGLKICFKFYSDWEFQTHDPAGPDYCSVEYLTGSTLGGASDQGRSTLRQLRWRYDEKGGERPFQKAIVIDLVDGYLRPGDHLLIRLGDRRAGGPGTRTQTFVERDFCFRALLDPLGTQRYARGPELKMDVVSAHPSRLILNSPRVLHRGEPTRLSAHVEDDWGNPVENLHGQIRFQASGSLSGVWDLPLPDDGWAVVGFPVRIDELGETEICGQLINQDGDDTASSSPSFIDTVESLPGGGSVWFGDLHVHTNDTVGTNDNEYNFSYARDVARLDFMGYTANDFQITDQRWAEVITTADKFTEEGKFVCFPGVEWCGTPGVGGDHNVVYIGQDTTLARSVEWHEEMGRSTPQPQAWPIARLYEAYEHSPQDYLLIPHVGGRRAVLDWHHPELERLVEVHSSWGPDPWFFEDAMKRGLRMGASGASDEHRGRPGGGHPGANIFGSRGGLCGVLSTKLDRGAIGKQLRARHTWATTGSRLVGLAWSGEHLQGDEFFSSTVEEVSYDFFGDAGWEKIQAYDGAGLLWERKLHQESGYDLNSVKLSWGGARVKDRYRWVAWNGSITVKGSAIDSVEPLGFHHDEHRVWRSADARSVNWQSKTYGDAHAAELSIRDLEHCRMIIDVSLDDRDANEQHWEIDGQTLLDQGELRIDIGGVGLFVSLERLSCKPLPRRVSGTFEVRTTGGPACVYLRARQRDGHEVWTSPLFIEPAG